MKLSISLTDSLFTSDAHALWNPSGLKVFCCTYVTFLSKVLSFYVPCVQLLLNSNVLSHSFAIEILGLLVSQCFILLCCDITRMYATTSATFEHLIAVASFVTQFALEDTMYTVGDSTIVRAWCVCEGCGLAAASLCFASSVFKGTFVFYNMVCELTIFSILLLILC